MTTPTPPPIYTRRKGLCEICGKLTNLLAWNRKFSEWDFVCELCQEALGILDSDWEDNWDY